MTSNAIVFDTPPTVNSSSLRTPLEPYGLQPHGFIQTLFGRIPIGYVEVTYLAPDGVKLYPHTVVQWADLPLPALDPNLPHIHAMNARGYSCYFAPAVRAVKYPPVQKISKRGHAYTVYPRGHAKDALYIPALWADIDEPGEAGYLRAIAAMPSPSIVVSSGGGFHAYWLLTEPLKITDENRDRVKQTLKGIALVMQSDTKVADLARIMRLPGTINTKPGRDNRLCEVIDFIPGYFDYQELEQHYAPLAAPPIPPPRRIIPLTSQTPLIQWVETYLTSGEAKGNRNTRAYAAARWLLDNGYSYSDVETMVGGRAHADGLAEDEIETILGSAERAPRGNPTLSRRMSMRMGVADKLLGGIR